MSALKVVFFWKLKVVPVKKEQNSLLLCWPHFKSSAIYIKQLLPVAYHEVKNFLAVTNTKPLKTSLLPIAAIVLSGIVKLNKDFILYHNIQSKLAKHASPKMLGWVQFPVGHTEKLKKLYLRLVEPCARGWWVVARERFTRGAAIDTPSTQHSLQKQPRGPQCKQAEMGAPQTTLQSIHSITATCYWPDFAEFNMNADHFQLLNGKSMLFCRPARNLCGLAPVRGPAVENHWFEHFDQGLHKNSLLKQVACGCQSLLINCRSISCNYSRQSLAIAQNVERDCIL